MKIIFVPAGGIEPNNKLGPNTTSRLHRALDLYRRYHNAILICTGGIISSCQSQPAAWIMKRWLVSNNVNPEAIHTYEFSLDTFQDVKGLIAIIDSLLSPQEISGIAVVSQLWHLRRIEFIISRSPALRRYPVSFHPACGKEPLLAEFLKLLFTEAIDAWGEGRIMQLYRKWLSRRLDPFIVVGGQDEE